MRKSKIAWCLFVLNIYSSNLPVLGKEILDMVGSSKTSRELRGHRFINIMQFYSYLAPRIRDCLIVLSSNISFQLDVIR
jgi:hypothetical protein